MTAFQLKTYLAVSGVTSKWNMQHLHEVWGIIKSNNYPSKWNRSISVSINHTCWYNIDLILEVTCVCQFRFLYNRSSINLDLYYLQTLDKRNQSVGLT
jgi:hypothetical protein